MRAFRYALSLCISRQRCDTWNFPSCRLCDTPQRRNAPTIASVVVMLSRKRRGGGITFHVFPPVTLTLTRWSSYTTNLTRRLWSYTGGADTKFLLQRFQKLSSDIQTDIRTDHTDRHTDIHTDTAKSITHATSRVVNMSECRKLLGSQADHLVRFEIQQLLKAVLHSSTEH